MIILSDKIISFDADGTLVKRDLVDKFWFEEVPRLYAKEHNIDQNEALDIVKTSYDEIGPSDIRWYLPKYWFNRFEISSNPISIIEDIKHVKEVYTDALNILKYLNGEYELIVISNAPREFLDVQLEEIEKYFSKIYSCVSDLEKVKKDSKVYKEILNKHNANSNELIHIGDDYEFDYKAPKEIGIESYFIDRERNHHKENGILRDLRDLKEILETN